MHKYSVPKKLRTNILKIQIYLKLVIMKNLVSVQLNLEKKSYSSELFILSGFLVNYFFQSLDTLNIGYGYPS